MQHHLAGAALAVSVSPRSRRKVAGAAFLQAAWRGSPCAAEQGWGVGPSSKPPGVVWLRANLLGLANRLAPHYCVRLSSLEPSPGEWLLIQWPLAAVMVEKLIMKLDWGPDGCCSTPFQSSRDAGMIC